MTSGKSSSFFHRSTFQLGRFFASVVMGLAVLAPQAAHAQVPAPPAQLSPVISALCTIFANIPGASSQAQYQQFCGTAPAPGGGGAPGLPSGGAPSPAALCAAAPSDPSGVACRICAAAGSACPAGSGGGGAPSGAPSPAALCTMAPQDPSGVACTICAGAGSPCPATGGTGGGGGGAPSQATVVAALCGVLGNVPMISSEPTGQYAANCKKAPATPSGSESSSSTTASSSPSATVQGNGSSSGSLDLGLLTGLLAAIGFRIRSKKRKAV